MIKVTQNVKDYNSYCVTIEDLTIPATRGQLERLYIALNDALAVDYESGLVEPDPVTNIKILSMGG